MKQTQTLASLFAQANSSDKDNNEFKFLRLKQEEVKIVALRDIPLSICTGPKNLKWIHIFLQMVYLH